MQKKSTKNINRKTKMQNFKTRQHEKHAEHTALVQQAIHIRISKDARHAKNAKYKK